MSYNWIEFEPNEGKDKYSGSQLPHPEGWGLSVMTRAIVD